MQPTPQLDLQIEELVLHGFDAADRYRIGAAVQRELSRLLAVQGVPPGLGAGGAQPGFDGGAFALTPGMRPAAIGRQVAQAVYRGLGR